MPLFYKQELVREEPDAGGVYFAELLGRVVIANQNVFRRRRQADAADALIRSPDTLEAAAVFKARGLTPAAAPKASS